MTNPTGDSWWRGASLDGRRAGTFPSNCVELRPELRPAEVPSFDSARDDGTDSGIESSGGGGGGGILQRRIQEQREARAKLEEQLN